MADDGVSPGPKVRSADDRSTRAPGSATGPEPGAAIADFAADWRAPLRAEDGYDAEALDAAERRLGVRLPTALREAYALFGRRDDLSRNQDRSQGPDARGTRRRARAGTGRLGESVAAENGPSRPGVESVHEFGPAYLRGGA